eukprot:gb/GEZN01007693.1/.p1 GENE.gb/GEZN01007693.1/~~gb/GEZN01007693.1/.p1  ORF type:complete len:450 (+),score=59.89 gb/GEZN01007693.1/:55-1404(+)
MIQRLFCTFFRFSFFILIFLELSCWCDAHGSDQPVDCVSWKTAKAYGGADDEEHLAEAFALTRRSGANATLADSALPAGVRKQHWQQLHQDRQEQYIKHKEQLVQMELERSEPFREALKRVIQHVQEKTGKKDITILDVGCGEVSFFSPMHSVLQDYPNIQYTGVDMVESSILELHKLYSPQHNNWQFVTLDLVDNVPTKAYDLVIARHIIGYLSLSHGVDLLTNLILSDSSYLLASLNPFSGENREITGGRVRALNLHHSPFNFPSPICAAKNTRIGNSWVALWKLPNRRAARNIIERYYAKLGYDFDTNKKICEEVATIPSKRVRNKVAGFVTHLMKRISRGPVRGISLKLQEEERERKMDILPEVSVLEAAVSIDEDTSDMIASLDFPNIENVEVAASTYPSYAARGRRGGRRDGRDGNRGGRGPRGPRAGDQGGQQQAPPAEASA